MKNIMRTLALFVILGFISSTAMTHSDSLVAKAKAEGYWLDTKPISYEKQGGKKFIIRDNYCILTPIIDTVLVDYYQRIGDNLFSIKVHGEDHNRICNSISELK
jgi:hypothetical protein